jgi:hypothetical protein
MKNIGKLFSIASAAGFWMIAGVRVTLEIIGYATLPEDAVIASGYLQKFMISLSTIPWLVILLFALISTMWLAWVSWSRAQPSSSFAVNESSHASSGLVRRLDADKSKRIAEYLRDVEMPQEQLSVFHFLASEECVDYAGDIISALTQAGWKASEAIHFFGYDHKEKDVVINVSGENYSPSFVTSLEKIFSEIGMKVSVSRSGRGDPSVSIYVGRPSS